MFDVSGTAQPSTSGASMRGVSLTVATDQGIDWSIVTAAMPLVAFLPFQRQFAASFMRAGIR